MQTILRRQSRSYIAVCIACAGVFVLLVWLNRAVLGEAWVLAGTADPWLVVGAGLATLLGYGASSQVFRVGLAGSGTRIGVVPLWAMTLTAIVISQLVPAGGVGSYAFFMAVFKRRGVSASQAVVLTALEALSFLGAMILFATFSVIAIAASVLCTDATGADVPTLIVAAGMTMALFGVLAVAGTRSAATLTRMALALSHLVFDMLRRPRDDERIRAVVANFVRERDMVLAHPRTPTIALLIQIGALSMHSLAVWLVVRSLGVDVGFAVAAATFGTTLLLGTVNVLPGGGGTVEAVLAAVLAQFGVGVVAIPAAVIFRLLNYWLLVPVAAGAAAWLLHDRREP